MRCLGLGFDVSCWCFVERDFCRMISLGLLFGAGVDVEGVVAVDESSLELGSVGFSFHEAKVGEEGGDGSDGKVRFLFLTALMPIVRLEGLLDAISGVVYSPHFLGVDIRDSAGNNLLRLIVYWEPMFRFKFLKSRGKYAGP